MKIAIVVGHNLKAQGAVRVVDGRTEFDWNSDLAEMIKDCAPECVRVFNRTPQGGYTAQVQRVYREVDAWGADVSVELHFNGSPNPAATGCLTLSSGSSGSLILAGEVHERMLDVMGNEDDGILVRRSGRGATSLMSGRAPAIITEPYFGGNERFCHVADARKDQLAEAIFEGAEAAVRMTAK